MMNGTSKLLGSEAHVDNGGIVSYALIARTIGLLVALSVVRLLYNGYVVRSRTKRLTSEYGIVRIVAKATE